MSNCARVLFFHVSCWTHNIYPRTEIYSKRVENCVFSIRKLEILWWFFGFYFTDHVMFAKKSMEIQWKCQASEHVHNLISWKDRPLFLYRTNAMHRVWTTFWWQNNEKWKQVKLNDYCNSSCTCSTLALNSLSAIGWSSIHSSMPSYSKHSILCTR